VSAQPPLLFSRLLRPPPTFFFERQTTRRDLSVLDEADVLALLAEALSADVQAVFSDETCCVVADPAGSSAFAELSGSGVPD